MKLSEIVDGATNLHRTLYAGSEIPEAKLQECRELVVEVLAQRGLINVDESTFDSVDIPDDSVRAVQDAIRTPIARFFEKDCPGRSAKM